MAISSVRSSPQYLTITSTPLKHSSELTRQMRQCCVLNLVPSKRIDRMPTWNLRSIVYQKNSECHENCELPEDVITWQFCIRKSDQFNTEAAECKKIVERICKEGNTVRRRSSGASIGWITSAVTKVVLRVMILIYGHTWGISSKGHFILGPISKARFQTLGINQWECLDCPRALYWESAHFSWSLRGGGKEMGRSQKIKAIAAPPGVKD